jgi:hypothetical protein
MAFRSRGRAFCHVVITSGLILWSCANASAATIANYTFQGNVLTSNDAEPNSTASNFTDGPGITGIFSVTGNPVPARAARYSDLTNTNPGAIANDDYFTFSATANVGRELDLTSLAFETSTTAGDVGRTGTFFVRSDADGFTANLASFTQLNSAFVPRTINLTGAAFQDLGSIAFRFYMRDAGSNENDFSLRIDNVTLSGSVPALAAPVPESSSALLFGMGGVALMLGRLRLRK